MRNKIGIQFALIILFILGISTGLKAQPINFPTPYCFPLYIQSPCNQPGPSNMPGNFVNDFIHSVITYSANVNINNPNSGCNAQNFPAIGFRNYIYHKCQHNLSVTAGQAVTFSIQVGNIFAQGVAVYIDWNLDNIFSNPAELVAASPGTIPAGGWGTYTVIIPPAQPNGTYRLRVRCVASTAGPTIDACNNYAGGETEDYDVYVGTTSPVISNALASSNSTVCSGNTLSLNLTYTSQCTPSYTWSGPNAFFSAAQNPTITNAQPLHSGNYSVTVSCGTACPVSLTTSVTVNQSPTPSNAGPSWTTCAQNTSTVLAGNVPAIGTGTWSVIQGSAGITQVNVANSLTSFIPTLPYNVLKWTIGNLGCLSSSTMSVTFFTPTIANAGPSQSLCMQTTATLAGNTPTMGIGTWSLVSGSAVITSSNSPTSGVTSLGAGVNVFKWTCSNPYCGPTVSQMTITNFVTPTLNVVSSSTTICSGNSATLTASGANQYNWQPSGSGSVIVVSPTIASTYTVIGNNASCFGAPATISINVDPAPSTAVAGPSISICSNTATLSGNTPSVGTGSWTLVSGAAIITNPNSPNTGLTAVGVGANILQWTTTLGNCTSTSTVLVQNSSILVSASSNTTVICSGNSATLTANGATNYTWMPSGGNSSIAVVSPTSTTVYTVTGTNGICSNNSSITQSVVICTGIKMVSINNDQLKIYPNPFKDELKIVSKDLIQIKLMDVSGKEVLRKEINGEVTINTSQLSKGIYFIHVIGSSNIKPIKVIKD